MKKLLLILSFLHLSGFINGQPPSFEWAQSFGNDTSYIDTFGFSLDVSGNSYTTGSFLKTVDFDPGPGVFTLSTSGSGEEFYAIKLDSNGNFKWAKSLVGRSGGMTVASDPEGNVYFGGLFYGTTDFDPGPGVFNMTSPGTYEDIFILKLDSSGNFIWAVQVGCSNSCNGNEKPLSITFDSQFNVYITGEFGSGATNDFDPGPGVYTLTSNGSSDVFILKLDSAGNFILAKGFGGSGQDRGHSIQTDDQYNIYVVGYFTGTVDFDPGPAVYNLTSYGSQDIFILKLSATGDFVWAKHLGGTGYDDAYSLILDDASNLFITGTFSSMVDFDPGPGVSNLTPAGLWDAYILKLDSAGNYIWSKSIGGPGYDRGFYIELDKDDNIYLSGWFQDTLNLGPGISVVNVNGMINQDGFVCKMDPAGNALWAYSVGSIETDIITNVIVDDNLNVYYKGSIAKTADLDPTSGVQIVVNNNFTDPFITKLSQTTTGLPQFNSNQGITIYPNPSTGLVNIRFSIPTHNVTLEIYNSMGALLQKITNVKTFETIDLSKYSKGNYFFRVVMQDGRHVVKNVVVQ